MYDDEFELTFDLSDEDKASRAPALEQEPVQEAAPEPAAERDRQSLRPTGAAC